MIKKALVYGAGVSGNGAKKLLEKLGYMVTIVDDKIGEKKESVMGKLKEYEIMIKSPGISFKNELVEIAVKEGIEIIDEIELAARNSNYKIIAVTGTNGKTTTTAKMTELLQFAGYKAAFAGNIGNSFAEFVCEEKELDFLVLELSSYQLEAMPTFKPYISIIINLTPDHLDRYVNLKEYYDTKFNILNNQDSGDYTIVNMDDIEIVNRYEVKSVKAVKIFVSKEEKLFSDFYVNNGEVYYKSENIMETAKLSLKGIHNLENILFMAAAAKIIGIPFEKMRDFFYSTEGLEHRMEEFYSYGKLEFINDSKGTNLDATLKAIDGYSEKVILICGGKDKKLDLIPLAKLIKEKTKQLFLIGETSDKLEALVLKEGYSAENIYNLKEIEKVISKMKEIYNGNEKEIVVFSPAASSFDQFKSFEDRGRIFKELVKKYFQN
jgi:UDP-N-acetylmuramoylalanine--D-glutamate ligase